MAKKPDFRKAVAELYGDDCCLNMKPQVSVEEAEHSVLECYAMVDHFVKLGDECEVAFWRGMLQGAKNLLRSLKTA